METREERQKALADKRRREEEQVDKIKQVLNSFLSDFSNSTVKVEHNYSLSDEIALKQLNDTLKSIEIPEVVKVKNQVTHTTEKKSHRFLWTYFFISSSMMLAAAAAAAYFYFNTDKIKDNAYDAGLIKGRNQVYKALPKPSQNYLDKKYPGHFGE